MYLDDIYKVIEASGAEGVPLTILAGLFTYTKAGIWNPIHRLEKVNRVFCAPDGTGCVRVYAKPEDSEDSFGSTEELTEHKSEAVSAKEYEMEKKEFGGELQEALLDTIAKFSAGKVLEEVMPLVKQKCVEEFGMVPVTHKIKVGDSAAVKMKDELPPCFDSILAYAVNGNAVMMTGPAGTGKGYLARKVAEAVNAEFFEVNAVKNSYDLTGFVDANSRFVRTPFYDACKAVSEGKKAVFLFDEMDCSDPEVLKIFNEALSSLEFTFPNDEHLTFDDLIIL